MQSLLKIFRISIVVCILVFVINFIFNDFDIEFFRDIKNWGVMVFYSISITIVNVLYADLFEKYVGWENAGTRRIFYSALGAIIVTLVAYFLCRLTHLVWLVPTKTIAEFVSEEKLRYYLFPLLFSTAITLFFHLIYLFKSRQEEKMNEQKIIAGTATSRFDALKNQLDPHFLFNSLNVLSSLIDEDPDKAQKFTGSLSKVYRYVLEQKSKELVTIEEELKFAIVYMNLLKMRFEDSIIYNPPTEISNLEAKVVPLSLQLLLENTVKHNKITPESPLVITIYETDKVLVVKNNLQPKEILRSGGSGVGLLNIKERYNLLTERTMEIIKTESEFMVRLPLLTKKTKHAQLFKTEKMKDLELANKNYLYAKEQVKKEKDFYGNLTSYCIIIPALGVFNYLTIDFLWVIFPAMGWGLGLLFHGLSAFNYSPFLGRDWEERKIKEIMNKKG
ncbi:2TM domain-containing protein [Zunongwangia endophytica]|uniref:2TM domain-containing protein n=1 Tax=Zunongwangia endophytica TaxID=1808945 RepID=A0ABV8HEY6_9FLAO|nr:2TM domain-containing protein [Zunongwangia endophytica]MDN3593801.1 2TM domain-containing protein [Zunongwangia endophytica]